MTSDLNIDESDQNSEEDIQSILTQSEPAESNKSGSQKQNCLLNNYKKQGDFRKAADSKNGNLLLSHHRNFSQSDDDQIIDFTVKSQSNSDAPSD
jgi:hypothetical protein